MQLLPVWTVWLIEAILQTPLKDGPPEGIAECAGSQAAVSKRVPLCCALLAAGHAVRIPILLASCYFSGSRHCDR